MSAVFERYLDVDYPSVVRGEGVHLYLDDAQEILDARSGGAMVACLGYGLESVIARAAEQAERISYFYFHHRRIARPSATRGIRPCSRPRSRAPTRS